MSSSSCSSPPLSPPPPPSPSNHLSIIVITHLPSPQCFATAKEEGENPLFPVLFPPSSPFHLPSLKFSSAVVATFPALPPSCHKAPICGFHYCTETEASFYGGKMAAVEAMVCGISRGMRRRKQKKSILQTRCFPLLHIVLCTRRHRRRRQTRRGEGRGKSRLVSWNVF